MTLAGYSQRWSHWPVHHLSKKEGSLRADSVDKVATATYSISGVDDHMFSLGFVP